MAYIFRILIFLLAGLYTSSPSDRPEWGFFTHRKINRYAVYSLPDPLFRFYKSHQAWLEEHAVDADKRRYALKREAQFHYIDLDAEAGQVPARELEKARFNASPVEIRVNRLVCYQGKGRNVPDSLSEKYAEVIAGAMRELAGMDPESAIQYSDSIGAESVEILVVDSFSIHGMLPYRIMQQVSKLEMAFRTMDLKAVLRVSADLGHYVGDAHVPLHTTRNYNGQLSGQYGIHAFWESRLPELFLHKSHYLMIRPAEYFGSVQDSVWQLILDSHALVEQVLGCEMDSRKVVPEDNWYGVEKRLNNYQRLESTDFSRAFDKCLGNMVWDRMEASVQFLGSLWYTAWANAGQPDLELLSGPPEDQAMQAKVDQETVAPEDSCSKR